MTKKKIKIKSKPNHPCLHSQPLRINTPTEQNLPITSQWLVHLHFFFFLTRECGLGFSKLNEYSQLSVWTVVVLSKRIVNCGCLRMEVGRKLFSNFFFPWEHLEYFILFIHTLVPWSNKLFLCCIFGISVGLFYVFLFFNVSRRFNLNHFPFIFLRISSYFFFPTFVLLLH